ncbi:hypothetical protein GMLC_04760 [Geomonas limicola]|uniref:LamG-like jellyroll fold domain-containing protein n=1 Tax=Geomonas limicola TaxID=2740186 RepID=A0A6V8N4Y8_9BACT|nr:LamG domain-containing protein [Geomonas limicola]GFO66897.1 hypothetical protein GMLC_04760 [Geomonas limicola]
MRLVVICFILSLIVGCGGGGGSNSATGVTDLTYKFDESSGATAANSSASFFNGTIYGANRVAGKSGNALHFGSSGARVEIPMLDPNKAGQPGYYLQLPFETNTISIDSWISLDSISLNSIHQIVGSGDGGLTSFRFQINNGKLELAVNDNFLWKSVILGNQVLTAGAWHHVAVTYNGTLATLYIDGAPDATNNITYQIPTNYNTLYVADIGEGPDHQLLGVIDELRISKKLRSGAEIAAYYQATR